MSGINTAMGPGWLFEQHGYRNRHPGFAQRLPSPMMESIERNLKKKKIKLRDSDDLEMAVQELHRGGSIHPAANQLLAHSVRRIQIEHPTEEIFTEDMIEHFVGELHHQLFREVHPDQVDIGVDPRASTRTVRFTGTTLVMSLERLWELLNLLGVKRREPGQKLPGEWISLKEANPDQIPVEGPILVGFVKEDSNTWTSALFDGEQFLDLYDHTVLYPTHYMNVLKLKE